MSFGYPYRFRIAPCLTKMIGFIFILACGIPMSQAGMTNKPLQYTSRMWQMDEGLPQNGVQALTQTQEGYLWVGTAKGLSRFDGARFKVFDLQNTPQLKNASVTALCQGSDGSLWIGTGGGGLTQLKDGKFKNFQLGDDSRSNNVKCISQSRDGSLWIGTIMGLVHWKDGVVTRYTPKDGLAQNVVRAVCKRDDTVYAATDAGLSMVQNGVVSNLFEFGDVPLRSVLSDHSGNLWVGWIGGLMCLSTDGQLQYYTKEDGLADNNVSMLFEDRRGELWIGTYGGLNRFANGKFTTEKDSQGGFYDQINAIAADHEGDIWVGGRDGLQELRQKRFTTYTRHQGLSHNNVMSVLEDQKGAIWIGTWGGGVSRLENGKITNYSWENSLANGLMTDLVLGLAEDTDGSILMGTDYEGGTFRFNQGKFTRIWSQQEAQTDRVIRVVFRDHSGGWWFGASPGLVLLKTHEHFLPKSTIRCMLEGRGGVLWVGTNRGLYYRRNGKFMKWSAPKNALERPILALYEDADRNLWIGTANNGLMRLHNGELTGYNTKQGLFSDDVFAILEDNDGWLWLSCLKGVYRLNKKNLNDLDIHKADSIACIAYGKADGMESVQCNGVAQPAAWKSRDGRMWFATAKGLVVTDPELDRDFNDKPPTVLLEEIVADKNIISPAPTQTGTGRVEQEKISVPAGRGELEIHFTALSLQDPERTRFKYKLDGFDRDWIEASRRVAYYNNLRPGDYTFQVIACNNDGIWNNAGASVALIFKPHFWQTWWFGGLIAGLLLASVAGVSQIVTRRNLQRQLTRVEQQRAIEQERIRIARDMHDEIGAKLTKISFLGAVAKRKLALPEEASQQIDKMSQTARDVIRALDEIVWAVNPANDSLENLATYLCRNATEFFDDSSIVCQFNIPPELPACRIGTHVRHNILLATKEAFNNALKHSGATNVRVQISDANGFFEVAISDNGRGFDPESNGAPNHNGAADIAPRTGNGLTNMRQRLESIGGKCTVESRTGVGTLISFKIRLNATFPAQSSNRQS